MGDLTTVLKDVEPEQVRDFCRGLLKDESTSTEQVQEQSDSENGTTPAESSATYVFVGAHDRSWPASGGTSFREKAIARKKEQSDA